MPLCLTRNRPGFEADCEGVPAAALRLAERLPRLVQTTCTCDRWEWLWACSFYGYEMKIDVLKNTGWWRRELQVMVCNWS